MNPCTLVFLAGLTLAWPAAPPATPTAPSPALQVSGSGLYRAYQPGLKRLLLVRFKDGMQERARDGLLTFTGAVDVLSLPADAPAHPIDLDAMLTRALPEGAVYFRCDRLQLLKGREETVPLEASGRVYLQTRTFYARAGSLSWREDRLWAALQGDVQAYRNGLLSGPPEVMTGKRFTLDIDTGHTFIERPAFRCDR